MRQRIEAMAVGFVLAVVFIVLSDALARALQAVL